MTSTIATSTPVFAVDEESDGPERISRSFNTAWINQILCNGYPVLLTHKLLGRTPIELVDSGTPQSSLGRQVLREEWNRSDAGQSFFKLITQAGFRAFSSPHEVTFSSSPSTTQPTPLPSDVGVAAAANRTSFPGSIGSSKLDGEKPIQSFPSLLRPERQRKLARATARRRVYNLSFLAQDRLWGPFLPYEEKTGLSPKASSKAKETTKERKGKEKVKDLSDADDGVFDDAPAKESPAILDSDEQDSMLGLIRDTANDGSPGTAETAEGSSSHEATAVPLDVMRAIVTNFGVYIQGPNFLEAVDQDDEDGSGEDEVEGEGVEGTGHTHNLVFDLLDLLNHAHTADEDDDEDFQPHGGEDDDTGSDAQSEGDGNASGDEDYSLHGQENVTYPMYPPFPHLVKPDYGFIAAARIIVEENLKERLVDARNDLERLRSGDTTGVGGMPAGWPWFMSVSAIEGTRDHLERISVEPLVDIIEGSSASDQVVNPHDRRDGGLEASRMGTMPGFWDGWNQGGVAKDESDQPISWDSGCSSNEDKNNTAGVDGWDWASVAGVWLRAVCWMDYRDLLFHNFRINRQNIIPHTMRHDIEQIQETCRVFSIALKITGYERVAAPLTLPPVPAMTSKVVNADVEREQNQETKGKGKEKETIPGERSNIMTDYNPLVYLLPVIHFEGEFRGSDVDARAHRRARGTVRMIGDGAVRWTMISSEASTPQRDEWTMEGVQVGGVGTQFGVIGLWTGARHEEGDPIGPTWAWKVT
ncbi:hypothetical protein VKT23_004532 [Stygiomarasmius scandens]